MATIDQLDISVYNRYALNTWMREQFSKQIRIDEASSIPPQTHILTTQIQLTELDLLLGVVPLHTPWAYFLPPSKFSTARRSPFTFARVAPSLKDTGEESEAYAALMEIPCENAEEEKEKKVIAACFKELSKLNNWLGFIVGRIGQFLQG